MVVTWQNSDRTSAGILARGNFSLGPDGLISLLVALAAVSLCLAGLLAFQGYWPILLVAVIQLVLVAWILIRAWQNAWVVDVIEVTADKIRVTYQRDRQTSHYELETAWAVIELKQPDIAWYRPRIQLRSRSQAIELGSFLTSEEKHQLVQHVKCAIEKHSAMKGALKS